MAGLASFVDGFTSGVDMRHKWDDRKRRNIFDDEDRAWQGETRGWDREDREYTLSERARARKAADEAEAARKADAAAYAEAYRTTGEYRQAGEDAATNAPRRSIMGDQGADVPGGMGGGLSFGAAVQGGGGRDPRDMNAPDMRPVGAGLSQTAPAAPPGPTIDPASLPDQRGAAGRQPRLVDIPGYSYDDWQGMTPKERRLANLPSSAIGAQMHFDRFSEGLGIPYQPEPRSVMFDERMTDTPEVAAAREVASAQDATRRREQVETPAGAQPDQPTPAVPTAAPAGSPADAAFAAPARRSVDPTATPGAANPAEAPSVQLAQAAAPGLSFGSAVSGSTRRSTADSSEQVEARASRNFLDDYMTKGVPVLMEHFLKTGQVDKARAFDTWVKEAGTQKSMKTWAKAAFAAATGNQKGMLDAFTEYHDGVDDGATVQRGESGFFEDPNTGTIMIRLVFKDDETGEKWEQVMEGSEDVLQQGIYALAPEAQFERLYEQNKDAQQVRRAGQEADQRLVEAAMKAAGASEDVVALAFKELDDSVIGFADLPGDEQIRKVLERLNMKDTARAIRGGAGAGGQGATAADLPVYQ